MLSFYQTDFAGRGRGGGRAGGRTERLPVRPVHRRRRFLLVRRPVGRLRVARSHREARRRALGRQPSVRPARLQFGRVVVVGRRRYDFDRRRPLLRVQPFADRRRDGSGRDAGFAAATAAAVVVVPLVEPVVPLAAVPLVPVVAVLVVAAVAGPLVSLRRRCRVWGKGEIRS